MHLAGATWRHLSPNSLSSIGRSGRINSFPRPIFFQSGQTNKCLLWRCRTRFAHFSFPFAFRTAFHISLAIWHPVCELPLTPTSNFGGYGNAPPLASMTLDRARAQRSAWAAKFRTSTGRPRSRNFSWRWPPHQSTLLSPIGPGFFKKKKQTPAPYGCFAFGFLAFYLFGGSVEAKYSLPGMVKCQLTCCWQLPKSSYHILNPTGESAGMEARTKSCWDGGNDRKPYDYRIEKPTWCSGENRPREPLSWNLWGTPTSWVTKHQTKLVKVQSQIQTISESPNQKASFW